MRPLSREQMQPHIAVVNRLQHTTYSLGLFLTLRILLETTQDDGLTIRAIEQFHAHVSERKYSFDFNLVSALKSGVNCGAIDSYSKYTARYTTGYEKFHYITPVGKSMLYVLRYLADTLFDIKDTVVQNIHEPIVLYRTDGTQKKMHITLGHIAVVGMIKHMHTIRVQCSRRSVLDAITQETGLITPHQKVQIERLFDPLSEDDFNTGGEETLQLNVPGKRLYSHIQILLAHMFR